MVELCTPLRNNYPSCLLSLHVIQYLMWNVCGVPHADRALCLKKEDHAVNRMKEQATNYGAEDKLFRHDRFMFSE